MRVCACVLSVGVGVAVWCVNVFVCLIIIWIMWMIGFYVQVCPWEPYGHRHQGPIHTFGIFKLLGQ